jgi:TonB family protein
MGATAKSMARAQVRAVTIILSAVLARAAEAEPACKGLTWAVLPTAEDVIGVYPPKARADGQAGRAILRCTLRGDGSLSECVVETEQPDTYGFGAAALQLSAKSRAAPPCAGADELKPGGVRLPIRFVLPGPPPRRFVFAQVNGYGSRLAPLGPYWPERALRGGIGGAVTMDCAVDEANRVSNCHIAEEAPPDQNFGNAVLKMMSRGLVTATPLAPGMMIPNDHVWRFQVVFPPNHL